MSLNGTLMQIEREMPEKSCGALTRFGTHRARPPRIRVCAERPARGRARRLVRCAGWLRRARGLDRRDVDGAANRMVGLVALTLISGSAVFENSVGFRELLDFGRVRRSRARWYSACRRHAARRDRQPGDLCADRCEQGCLPRILFNAAAPPVAMWVSARAFFYMSGFSAALRAPFVSNSTRSVVVAFRGLYL